MNKTLTTMAAAAIALAAGQSTQAVTILTAELTTSQEVTSPNLTASTGGARPTPFGTATFTINDAQTQMSFTATIFNIDIDGSQTPNDANDNLVNAHIHVGAPAGANGPVRWGFHGMPDNDTNPKNMVVTKFASGVGGTFSSIWDQPEGNAMTTFTDNLPGILAGLSYINFHTVQNPGGEIRGQIVPDQGSTALLLGSSLAMIGLARRRVGKV